MRNQQLYRAMREYCRDALTAIQTDFPAGQVPVVAGGFQRYVSLDVLAANRALLPAFVQFVNLVVDTIRGQAAYQAAEQAVKDYPAVSRHLDVMVWAWEFS